MTESQIRAEYSKLRSVANKRLQRLEAAGIGMRAMEGYKFPTIAQILGSSKSTVASELANVSRWLGDYRSTITGESQFISEFKEMMLDKGYGSLVEALKKNIELFVANMDALEKVQPTKGGRTFSSNRVNALVRKWTK